MASKSEERVWETFVRRPGDLKEGEATPMVLRDLTPGRTKYSMRHVVAVVAREGAGAGFKDRLRVRTVVGVELPESWRIEILRELPIELPGRPYHDFYEALKAAAEK
ncbi:MAG TPA: hypothetical protein VNN77_11450 [candidate division Zixibacteria bacterium]|nr:hypothetical protein [candidate division Zixibacteria bacterium]